MLSISKLSLKVDEYNRGTDQVDQSRQQTYGRECGGIAEVAKLNDILQSLKIVWTWDLERNVWWT
jgi:hypothetical protein